MMKSELLCDTLIGHKKPREDQMFQHPSSGARPNREGFDVNYFSKPTSPQREELAVLIAKHHDNFFGVEYDEPATQDYGLADELMAAGWTKPRTITTVAELLALHMVVVRTAGGTIANIVNERASVFGYEASVRAETLALPATVLYDGAP